MPRIHTIAADSVITGSDKLIGTDGGTNANAVTRNYTIDSIKTFVLNGTHAGSFTTLTTSGNATIGGNLSVTGNATIAGNLTFGNADTDTVSFSADVNSHILPDVTNTYDLGSSNKIWRNIYAGNATFTGDIQLGNATTDAASEIKAYGELGLRADSDNDTGYTWGVELFRTRFGNAGGTAIQFNVNQYSNGTSGNLLDANTIFDTIQAGDVIYGLGGGSNYQSNTDETVASVNGFYNASSQFLSATDPTGAAYFQVTMSSPVSYQSNAHLTVLPANETFVSGGAASSIKFYADTTTIGTLNESLFSIPGKATIGGFTIPNTIGSAQQVLRVPSSGTELEWATLTAADTIGTLSVTPMSGADDFKVLINGNSAGISVLSNSGTSGSSSVVVGKDGQVNGGIFEYNKSSSAVRIQRHGAVYITVDANGVKLSGIPTHADDTAAGNAGLSAGHLYKTSGGDLKIKL